MTDDTKQLQYLEGKILGLEFLSLTLVTLIHRLLSKTTFPNTREQFFYDELADSLDRSLVILKGRHLPETMSTGASEILEDAKKDFLAHFLKKF